MGWNRKIKAMRRLLRSAKNKRVEADYTKVMRLIEERYLPLMHLLGRR